MPSGGRLRLGDELLRDGHISQEQLLKALDEQKQAGLTQNASLTGTPLYMSPEAIQLPNSVDSRSDLYAVGAVGYSQGGGVVELVVPEQDALSYPLGDVNAMTAQVRRLVVDPQLRRQLGDAARRAAIERFNPERFTEQMIELYTRFDRAAAA